MGVNEAVIVEADEVVVEWVAVTGGKGAEESFGKGVVGVGG